jgi:hypothetical protein
MIPTKSAVQLIGAVVFLAFVVLAIHFLAIPDAEASAATLTKTYTNAAYGFTLKMPADFSAYPQGATPDRDATGAPTGQAIVLKDARGAAVQIVVTPDGRAASSNILTAEDIEQLAPYFDLSQAEPLQIAPGVIGMTFVDTEHPVYGSSTANVWFAYRGNLYEVIADANDGALFRSMIATWAFI